MTDRDQRIAEAFDRLFRTYQQSDRGADLETVARERMERAAVYFEAVAPYETQDIETAVRNFLTGQAPGVNPAFAPSAPLVAAECLRVRNLRLDSEARARPALPPPPLEPRSERVAEGLKQLAASLRTEEAARDLKRSRQRSEKEQRWLLDRGDLVEIPGQPYPVSRALLSNLHYTAGDPDGDREIA